MTPPRPNKVVQIFLDVSNVARNHLVRLSNLRVYFPHMYDFVETYFAFKLGSNRSNTLEIILIV